MPIPRESQTQELRGQPPKVGPRSVRSPLSMRPYEEEEVKALKGVIAWFRQSSRRLTAEYRRLEERVADLNGELERKNRELERSLREREAAWGYLLSVLESLKAGVLVVDQDLRPTFTNRRLRELVGEVDERRAVQLIGEKLAYRLKRGEKDFLPLECERVVHGLGTAAIPVHLIVSEVLVAAQKSVGYVLVFQDISRLKRLEAEAARARRLAALGEMAAGIAHEVRNPLGGIELCASLLKELGTGRVGQLATEILTAVQRLQTTLSHLLSFAAEPRIAAESLPVPLLLKAVEEMALPLLCRGPWRLEIAVEDNLPPLWADRELLLQALLNLVVNATEAMPQGGTVRITAQRSVLYSATGRIHREVEIKVVDEGVGIAPEDRERIFDPFFTTKRQGTGLGLALTHKIICAHHGTIEVYSEPGQGSCFTLCLPVADCGIPSLSPVVAQSERLQPDC
ncbi:MAG: ATP-binding protein [Candidatus Binatia bacterium]|nr:ATP-binding protein [Candidatus Binatia bacterium]